MRHLQAQSARLVAAVATAAAVGLSGSVALAQAPNGFDRPSITIVGLDLPPHLQTGLNAFCGDRCAGAIGDRADINTLAGWNYSSGQTLVTPAGAWAPNATATIQSLLGTSSVSRNTILRLFNAGTEFNWTLDTLAARARYAITVEEAQRLLRAQRGVNRNEFRQILPTYFFVFTVARDTVRTTTVGQDPAHQQTFYHETATLLGAVYRLGYPDIAAAIAALGPLSCFRGDVPPTCTDANRDARRAAFAQYTPPLTLVTSFSEPIVAALQSSEANAHRTLMGAALSTMIARTATADSRFASQGRVIGPGIAARIGKKEGVRPNAGRFFAMRRDSTPGRPARNVRVGVVIPSRVADNRRVVFTTGPNGAQIARMDSSTFKQIHGGSIQANRGITLLETRYIGSFSAGGVIAPGLANPGLMLQAEYRVPGLPTGAYLGLTGSTFAADSGELNGQDVALDSTTSLARVGLVFGQEFFPLHGFLRFRAQIEGGAAFVLGDSTVKAATTAGGYASGVATVAIAPSYRWNIFGSAVYTQRFANCDTVACVGPKGVSFVVGVRVEP